MSSDINHMGKINCLKYFLPIIPLFLLVGCQTNQPKGHPITVGVLATPGCTIEAEDGSFKIVSGQQFSPPFQMDEVWPGFVFGGGDKANERLRAISPVLSPTTTLQRALQDGAKRVRITVPDRDQPLYGVLALLEVPYIATGPATRSYEIVVPKKYVDSASGGRLSVVYEIVHSQENPTFQWYPWILWMSDSPILSSSIDGKRTMKFIY